MPAAPESVTPRRLGPYLLGRRLGAGGMATVFAARQESAHVKRLVALKVLSSTVGRDDPDHRAFMREALLATRLEHPNIVRTYDVGDQGGALYIAMELIHGASISACQKAFEGPAPLRVAVRVGLDIARGLHTAHELADPERGPLGVVHQDVSPQNVLVAYDGSIKLVDFGVARFAAIEGSRTETLRGKAAYASPEQLAGKNIDRRTDVFALGVLLWELFAGRRLFRKENNAATYVAILQEAVPDLCSVNATVPESIADVVARALDRNRDARFPTADALARALSSAASESGTGWAENAEVADWVTKLVPPQISPAEIEREIVSSAGPIPSHRGSMHEGSGQHPAGFAARSDAAVPDLDLPVGPASARVSRPAMSAPAPATVPSAATDDDDDFDMQIERSDAFQIVSAPPSGPGRPSTPSAPRVSHISAIPRASLDVAYRRSDAFAHVANDDEPSIGRKALGCSAALLLFAATGGVLFKLAHRSGGFALTNLLPHAFDATSPIQSGAFALALLVAVVVLGFVGFRLRPRSWALIAAAVPTLLTSLAMVTVTLVATEEQPSPADGARLVPYALPLAGILLAAGLTTRAGRLFAESGVARTIAGVPLAAIGGAIAFLALEASALAR